MDPKFDANVGKGGTINVSLLPYGEIIASKESVSSTRARAILFDLIGLFLNSD